MVFLRPREAQSRQEYNNLRTLYKEFPDQTSFEGRFDAEGLSESYGDAREAYAKALRYTEFRRKLLRKLGMAIGVSSVGLIAVATQTGHLDMTTIMKIFEHVGNVFKGIPSKPETVKAIVEATPTVVHHATEVVQTIPTSMPIEVATHMRAVMESAFTCRASYDGVQQAQYFIPHSQAEFEAATLAGKAYSHGFMTSIPGLPDFQALMKYLAQATETVTVYPSTGKLLLGLQEIGQNTVSFLETTVGAFKIDPTILRDNHVAITSLQWLDTLEKASSAVQLPEDLQNIGNACRAAIPFGQ